MSVAAEFKEEAALHKEGSRARKMLTWAAIELEDRRLQIDEMAETENARLAECEQLRRALTQGADQLESVVRFMRDAAFTMDSSAFARDFAGWINLMGIHHKDPDYGSASKPRPHKDTRR